MLDARTPDLEELLTRGVTYLIDENQVRAKLAKGEKLRIKFGVDPTGPTIHIGRAVPLWKLRAFQDLGHTVIFLVGDFTAQIGDASDKTDERPMLTKEQVQENLKGYLDQVGKIVDLSKAEVVYNSDWLSKLNFAEISQIADAFSVAEMLDRDNFSKRFESGTRISLREFMYPLMQGYDSVAVKADLEIGGNDQYFNLMAGRTIQKKYGQAPQDIMTFEFLVGLDGRKMSTSWGNCIYIVDEPQDMFGKIMTVNDDLIETYFRLATDLSLDQISEYLEQLESGVNPRDIKLELAKEIVRRYHGDEAAENAHQGFLQVFSEGALPEDIQEISAGEDTRFFVLVSDAFGVSKSEARRVISEGGIKVDGEPVTDPQIDVTTFASGAVLQKGKRHFRKLV